jgi:signal transduction histidine kinase
LKIKYFFITFLFLSCVDSRQHDYTAIDKTLKKIENEEVALSETMLLNMNVESTALRMRNDSYNRKCLIRVARNYKKMKNYGRALRLYEIILKNSQVSRDTLSMSISNLALAKYYNEKWKADKAYFHFRESIKGFKKINKNSELANAYIGLGVLQYNISDYFESQKSILNAIEVLKSSRSDESISWYRAYSLLGVLNCELKDFAKAEEFHRKAIDIMKENSFTKAFLFKETSLNNLGYNYQQSQQYRKSIDCFTEALQSSNIQDDLELFAILKDNLAYSQLKLGNSKAVPQLFFEALRIREEIQNVPGIIINKIHLSEYYSLHKNSNKAYLYASEAYNIAQQNKLPAEEILSLRQLILTDYTCSIILRMRFVELSDSLQLAERKTRNKFARIAYETDEITHEKDNAVKQKWIAYSASGMSIVIGGLLLLVRVQRSKQRELLFEQEQQKSNESIYRLINDQQIRIDEARQAEKTRIAQELHDGVMNRLASTRLNLFVLNKQKDDQTIKKCISLIDGIQDIEKEIRQVAHDLNHEIFSGNNSFHTLLEALFESQKTGSAAAMYSESDQSINWAQIDSAVKMNIYRILQEALQNANKHAKAKNIFVTVSRDESEDIIHINVYDDGIGFNPAKNKGGIGMKNMRERVAAINGKFEIQSPMGKGTNLRIAVPVRRIV